MRAYNLPLPRVARRPGAEHSAALGGLKRSVGCPQASRGQMKNIGIVLLSTWLLLPAARVWAQAYDAAGPIESSITRKSAMRAGSRWMWRSPIRISASTTSFGSIDYWYQVDPGKCKLVFSHFYAPNNLFSFQSFPLYLAFAFTDSTGVRGAAKVNPRARHCRVPPASVRREGELRVPSEWQEPRRHNVSKGPSNPRVDRLGTDARVCIPVNLVDTPHPRDSRSRSVQTIGRSRLGPQASPGGAVQGPGKPDEFIELLRVAVNALPDSQKLSDLGMF